MVRYFKNYPQKTAITELLPAAYRFMYAGRRTDEHLIDLFHQGKVKGTVTTGHGTEATCVGMSIPFRFGKDIISLLHRDISAHLVLGSEFYELFCQYLANSESPTFGREGNVHHGNAIKRKFPMISHLGNMVSTVVGGVYGARMRGENVFGLSVTGDGGTSTGDFHESINFASVNDIPVLFIVENNNYAFSTPVERQFNCKKLSERAAAYGIPGKTIDGTDIEEVYTSVYNALKEMDKTSSPYFLECKVLRMKGHAVYDKAEYVTEKEKKLNSTNDPLPKARKKCIEKAGYSEETVLSIEKEIDQEIEEALDKALKVGRPAPHSFPLKTYADLTVEKVQPFELSPASNGKAVNSALDYILRNNPEAFLLGQDIGKYGSAFKTCKGLFEKYGPKRIIDTPICESATSGVALGASQTGGRPVMEFQFADFSTESMTLIGHNNGSWYFRTHNPAPVMYRLPCGGGITLGAFHSGEFEKLWSSFPGLKLFYPYNPQETFEALLCGFYDPNPCLIFEHKRLYWTKKGDIIFDGNLPSLYRARKLLDGDDLTVIGIGAALNTIFSAANKNNYSIDLWNPFILKPLDIDSLVKSVEKTGRLLIVQESTSSSGIGDTIISEISKRCFNRMKNAPVLISAHPDIPVPFAPELESHFLPDENKVQKTIETILKEKIK